MVLEYHAHVFGQNTQFLDLEVPYISVTTKKKEGKQQGLMYGEQWWQILKKATQTQNWVSKMEKKWRAKKL